MHTASLFMDNWIKLYGIQSHMLTDNAMQFVSRIIKLIVSSWEQNIWRPQRIISKLAHSQKDLITRLSPNKDTRWQSTREIGTYMYILRLTRITSKRIVLRIHLFSEQCFQVTPRTYIFLLSYGFTDWLINDNIPALNEGKTTTPHCHSASRRW